MFEEKKKKKVTWNSIDSSKGSQKENEFHTFYLGLGKFQFLHM